MNTEMLPDPAEVYLRALGDALADAPAPARAAALEDVRAHLGEALESGRSVDEALAGLGPAQAFAGQYREELALPARDAATASARAASAQAASARAADRAARSARVLYGATVVGALLTVALNVYLANVRGTMTPGGTALLFVPAVLATLPLVLPERLRVPVALANAGVITGAAFLTGFGVSTTFAPLALLLWVAAVVPWRVSKGLDLSRSPIWRVVVAVVVAAPALLTVSGILTGSFGVGPVGVAAIVGILLLALGFAVGIRTTAPVIAGLGLALMLTAFLELGMLFLGVWWAGGLYLGIGLGSLAAWPARTTERGSR